MPGHPALDRFAGIHALIHRRHQCDFAELAREIQALEAEVAALVAALQHPGGVPATVTVTTTDQEGNTVSSFAPGATITFTAVSDNKEGTAVTDTYTWTATAGTVVPGADTTTITISDAPIGDVTVTATDPAGLSGSVTATVADQTPASVTVTAA